MSFFNRDNGHCCGVSFVNDPDLVNHQYRYMSLGEMVALYHQTGQFPAVGIRNGVYTGDIVAPLDRFDILDMQRDLMSRIESEETKLQELKDEESRKKQSDLMEQINALKYQIANLTSSAGAGSAPGEE